MKFKLVYLLSAVTLTSIRADLASSAGLADYSHLDNGHVVYGNHAGYGNSGYGTSGLYDSAAYGNLNAYGAVGGSLDRFKDSLVYSRDRGYGYEKAYAYDREVSLDDTATKKEAYGSIFGLNDNTAQSDLNVYNRQGQTTYGNRGIFDASGYGRFGHLNSGYINHGVGVYGYIPAPGRSSTLPVAPPYRYVTPHVHPRTPVYGLAPTFEHSLAHTISPAHKYTSVYGES